MFRNRKMESERPKQEQEQLSLPSAFEKGWKTNRLQKLSSSQIFSKHTLRGETFFENLSSRVYTHRFNFLTHAFSFLNRNIPNQNSTYCIAFLPWFEEMNLGLAHLALKMHAFFACVNACRNSA